MGSATGSITPECLQVALLSMICVIPFASCSSSPLACESNAQCFASEACVAGACVMQPDDEDTMVTPPSMDMSPPIQDMTPLPDSGSVFTCEQCEEGMCDVDNERCIEGCRENADCDSDAPVCDINRAVCVQCVEVSDCTSPGSTCVNHVCVQQEENPITILPEQDILSWYHVTSYQNSNQSPLHYYITEPVTIVSNSAFLLSALWSSEANNASTQQYFEQCNWTISLCYTDEQSSRSGCEEAIQAGDFPENASAYDVNEFPLAESLEPFETIEFPFPGTTLRSVLVFTQQCPADIGGSGFGVIGQEWEASLGVELRVRENQSTMNIEKYYQLQLDQ